MSSADDGRALPAGEFCAWLREMQALLAGSGDSGTPCGDCCASCSSSCFVHVEPDEQEALSVLPRALAFPAPGAPAGHLLLPYDARGRSRFSPSAAGAASTIAGRAPAASTTAACSPRPASRRTGSPSSARPRWEFTSADEHARAEHAAVRAAARFVRDNAGLFPGGAVPEGPAQLAVLAVKAAGVLVAGGGEPGDPGRPAPRPEIAGAVLLTVAGFGGGREPDSSGSGADDAHDVDG